MKISGLRAGNVSAHVYVSVGLLTRLPFVLDLLFWVPAACMSRAYTYFVHMELCAQVVSDGQLQVEEEIERQKEVCASLMLSMKSQTQMCIRTCIYVCERILGATHSVI